MLIAATTTAVIVIPLALVALGLGVALALLALALLGAGALGRRGLLLRAPPTGIHTAIRRAHLLTPPGRRLYTGWRKCDASGSVHQW